MLLALCQARTTTRTDFLYNASALPLQTGIKSEKELKQNINRQLPNFKRGLVRVLDGDLWGFLITLYTSIASIRGGYQCASQAVT